MESRKSVLVLMSTYDGERFIGEQLQSIYSQEGVDVSLLVRDDGSHDSTSTLLEKEQAAGRLRWYRGENLGPALSFWNLVKAAPDAPYYAFADQDDVWDKDKLAVAVDKLIKAGDEPALYFCRPRVVDAGLNEIYVDKITPLLTYGESLTYHFVTGCTMVMNRAMRSILLCYTPAYIRMHDMWVYNVAQAVGAHIIFDKQPHISYRQHSNNVIGTSNTFKKAWKDRLVRLKKNDCIRSTTAKELLKGYSTLMTPERASITTMAANYKKNLFLWIKLLFTCKMRCAPLMINISSKLAVLLRIF